MFKETFKNFKCKKFSPDFNEVLDFNKNNFSDKKVRKIELNKINHTRETIFGLIPSELWDIYEIHEKPGLKFIKNPFTCLGQRYWTIQCLENFTKKPNKLNLDPFKEVPNDNDWWKWSHETNNKELLQKLRWATLGYHHNWDTKVYSEDSKSDFPEDLAYLSQYLASILGYSEFQAQAAILNFYHFGSTLSGHTDHSEMDLEAPLISISFGQTAIFLIGGKNLEEKPLPLFLHSGDIIFMTKEARLCYHGVPRIVPTNFAPWDEQHIGNESGKLINFFSQGTISQCQDELQWQTFAQYLKKSRINLNVRQVLYKNQKSL